MLFWLYPGILHTRNRHTTFSKEHKFLADPVSLYLLPLSITIGLILPTLLLSLRSNTIFHERHLLDCARDDTDKTNPLEWLVGDMFNCNAWYRPFQKFVVSNEFKQWSILFWYFYPVWIGLVQVLLRRVIIYLHIAPRKSNTSSKREYI